ncbi:MAG: sigma-70 family RNA polymerase sigma factor [Thermoguttaceae bacterium]|jgi:RNA polymerase sigma-70 factor (ECF subfamily)|nr:sigma-70 family RNA polymerase sigma factor [Thermoguttaceae bacterium]
MAMTQPSTAGGDRPAGPPPIDWEAVLASHDRWLRTVVYARVGEPQAVDDVMQEVALAAVRQKSPLEDPAKVAPWLYRLAVTQSLLYRRKQGRRRKLADRYTRQTRLDEHDARQRDPLAWLLAAERREMVGKALDRLAGRDREILLLKYTEDCSYRDLAERLGTTVTAVQARLHRARERLREELIALDAHQP